MKKALIVVGAALALGSRKGVTVVPCSERLEIRNYYKGKLVNKSYRKGIIDMRYGRARPASDDEGRKDFITDSLVIEIVPVKVKP